MLIIFNPTWNSICYWTYNLFAMSWSIAFLQSLDPIARGGSTDHAAARAPPIILHLDLSRAPRLFVVIINLDQITAGLLPARYWSYVHSPQIPNIREQTNILLCSSSAGASTDFYNRDDRAITGLDLP